MSDAMARNVTLLRWYGFLRNLIFWQATWFLFFQNTLSAAEAILLYAAYDLATMILEVPSGWASDRLGRKKTLMAAAFAGGAGMCLLATGQSFEVFLLAQVLMGVHSAFVSGTDQAMLYESLAANDRADEVETQSITLWRFSFVALAISAVIGGAAALYAERLPFILSAAAFAGLVLLSFRFQEPPHKTSGDQSFLRLSTLGPAFRNRVLMWLFGLGLVMYGYSHIPFVFGQPFILDALAQLGLDGQAPLISGTVTMLMMALSVLVSLAAPALRTRLGLSTLLLTAFGLQVALAGMLSLTNAPWAIALLLLRMVSGSLSTPFINARMQPLLQDETRATFVSLKSLIGRLFFAGSLAIAAGSASDVGTMPFSEISAILGWYASGGFVLLLGFALTARAAGVDKRR